MTTQAERLAEIFEQTNQMYPNADVSSVEVAAELRRLVSFNQQLMDEVARLNKERKHMTTLIEILNNPEEHYPCNFDTPQRAVALLSCLCQDAAIEIERLQKLEWVGLTESEKSAALYDADGMTIDYDDYAEAIEAKLKAKNERKEKNT